VGKADMEAQAFKILSTFGRELSSRKGEVLNEYGETEDSPCYKFEYEMSLMANSEGLEFKRCSQWHFHLRGVFLLNVYPSTGTVYVQGSNGKMQYKSLKQLIDLCNGVGRIVGVDKGRRFSLKKKRKAIWAAGERHCFVCGEKFKSFDEATLEHKVPLSQGGSNRRDNLALSHDDCNKNRGHNLGINLPKGSHE
jgi:hypothetical protein